MAFIQIDTSNIDSEHICCAITEKKGESCVASKKAWMKEALDYGLVFRKLDQRGKIFIEYIPSEYAWAPVDADNYLTINCLWVSGKFKGQGYGKKLLITAIEDAKNQGKHGLVVLSSPKKKPFLSDPKFLKAHGFTVCDSAPPYFELLYLPLKEDAEKPRFKAHVKSSILDDGVVLYYSHQCPHVTKYIEIVKRAAETNGIPMKLVHLLSYKEAQMSPAPFTTYSLFIDGVYRTNEILTEKKFLELVASVRS